MKEFKIKKILNNTCFKYKFFQPFYILLLFYLTLVYGCSNLKKNENINICSSTSLPCLFSNEYVLFITNRGNIKLELYGKSAPITVGNFIDLVGKGAYNKTIFNRVIS